jgi:two-component system cell cycle response regulator DivK
VPLRTVLLAEGDDVTRREYRAAFEGSDYAVIEARNGLEAWDILKQFRPDVVVTGHPLVTPDGSTLARRIKRAPETRNIKVVSMVAEQGPDAVAAARAEGADVVVPVPSDVSNVVEEVMRLVAPPLDAGPPAGPRDTYDGIQSGT